MSKTSFRYQHASIWLEHASPQTTLIKVESDLKMKAKGSARGEAPLEASRSKTPHR
jgi:hypothetical protein